MHSSTPLIVAIAKTAPSSSPIRLVLPALWLGQCSAVLCGYESGVVLRIGCDLAEVDLSIWVIEQMSNLS